MSQEAVQGDKALKGTLHGSVGDEACPEQLVVPQAVAVAVRLAQAALAGEPGLLRDPRRSRVLDRVEELGPVQAQVGERPATHRLGGQHCESVAAGGRRDPVADLAVLLLPVDPVEGD